MKKINVNETILLTLVVGITLLIQVLQRTFLPAVILMEFSVPNMAGLCLIALVLNAYLGGERSRGIAVNLCFGEVIFGLLPLLAGVTQGKDVFLLAIVGGVEYALISGVFATMTDRMENTVKSRLAPICSAFVLFLACQGFANMLL
ncbi:MAG: hypothetical protein PUI41_02845 [Lachnospiraceae bacterium]|nr:hypothetical protein [Lachnospiraceae bacterium]MDD7049846.1 hypothetical protein [Lachnospiraceae bacterium]MDY4096408.1 hypothetical protein [Lachnospiraceae bacterium]